MLNQISFKMQKYFQVLGNIMLSFLCRLIPNCCLEIESEIDFGEMIANNKLVTKEISIANRGSASGKYLICIKSYKYFILLENIILCKLTRQ